METLPRSGLFRDLVDAGAPESTHPPQRRSETAEHPCPICLDTMSPPDERSVADLDFGSRNRLIRALQLYILATERSNVSETAALECGHAYHAACLQAHARSCKLPKCAMCRAPMVKTTSPIVYSVHGDMHADASPPQAPDGAGVDRFSGVHDNGPCVAFSAIASLLTLVGLSVCCS